MIDRIAVRTAFAAVAVGITFAGTGVAQATETPSSASSEWVPDIPFIGFLPH